MRLLLLLSALLSALTGAQTQARAASAPVAVSQAADRAAVVRVARSMAAHLVARSPGWQDGPSTLPTAWTLAPAAPLYLSRRRE